MAETHSYLTRLPLDTWTKLQEEAGKKQISINSIVVDAVEQHLASDLETSNAVAFYRSSRSFASDLLGTLASATGDSSYDMAISALAGTPEETDQDGIPEEGD